MARNKKETVFFFLVLPERCMVQEEPKTIFSRCRNAVFRVWIFFENVFLLQVCIKQFVKSNEDYLKTLKVLFCFKMVGKYLDYVASFVLPKLQFWKARLFRKVQRRSWLDYSGFRCVCDLKWTTLLKQIVCKQSWLLNKDLAAFILSFSLPKNFKEERFSCYQKRTVFWIYWRYLKPF